MPRAVLRGVGECGRGGEGGVKAGVEEGCCGLSSHQYQCLT